MAKNNKKISIEYASIDNEIYENNIVRISKDYPTFDKYKELYLYELFNHEFLEQKIRLQLMRNFTSYQFYDSFILQLTDIEFEEIKYMFADNFKSDLELVKSNDELNRMLLFLNTSVKIAQKDPKMWEI